MTRLRTHLSCIESIRSEQGAIDIAAQLAVEADLFPIRRAEIEREAAAWEARRQANQDAYFARKDAEGKHVVALSGGKDSTAMALRLAEVEPRDYTFVCTPTGNEPDAMFAHWKLLGEMLGKPIVPIMAGTLHGLVRSQRALPNHRQRWCTRKLKLEPYYGWLATQTPCVSYVGLRADEETRAGMIFPDANGVQMDFPMQRWGWGIDDVLGYLDQRGVVIPERSDCKDCFWMTLAELWRLWRDDLPSYIEGEELEEWVTAERGERRTWRSPQRDTWPARRRDLRARFEAGEIPTRSIAMEARRKAQRGVGACRACTL